MTLMPLIPESERKRQDLSGDGGVVKVLTSPGKGPCPKDGDFVSVQYVASHGKDGVLFDSSRKHLDGGYKFKLGDRGPKFLQLADGMIRPLGWDIAIRTMKVGESAMLYLTSKYAFGEAGVKHPNRPGHIVPPGTTVAYNLEVVSIDKDVTFMSTSEICEQGEKLLLEGTGCFRQGELEKSEQRYLKALEALQAIKHIRHDESPLHTDDGVMLGRKLIVRGILNFVSCKLKRFDISRGNKGKSKINKNEIAADVVKKCSKAIDILESMKSLIPNSEAEEQKTMLAKALYRQGKGYLMLRKEKMAKDNFYRAHELLPKDKGIRREYVAVKKRIMDAKKNEKQIFGGIMKKDGVSLYEDKDDVPVAVKEEVSLFDQIYTFLRLVFCCKKKIA